MTALGLAVLAMVVVLGVSGATKIPARRETEDAFEALRIPLVPRGLGAAMLPWAEITLAVALLVLRGPALVAATVGVLLLSLGYTAVIARALRFEEPVTCTCFGRFGASKVSVTSLWRNIVMSIIAVFAVVAAADGQHVWGLLTENPWWVVLATLVATLSALVVSGSGGPADASVRADGEPDEELLDYIRHPIPYAQLRTSEGTPTTIRDLARQQARLLLFLSSGCGSCRRVIEHMDEWHESLSPAVAVVPVFTYDPGPVEFSVPWYLDPDRNTGAVLEIHGTPSAVLLGLDGLIAGGPVSGEQSIETFVGDILAELGAAEQPVTAGPTPDHNH